MINSKSIIFILGMHRSGTSAVTRLLNLLGVELGSNLIDGIKNINESGFWENKDFLQINENILKSLNSSWFDVRSFPESWWNSDLSLQYVNKIKQIIKQDFNNQLLIGVKDPRLCRLLPVWLTAVKDLNFSPKCLLVVRNPCEVAASLLKRDSMGQETAIFLWLQYVLESEFYSRGLLRTVIDYSEVLINWENTVLSIENTLDIKWPNSIQSITKAVSIEISSKYRHHYAGKENKLNKETLTQLAVDVYSKLCTKNIENLSKYFDTVRDEINKKEFLKDNFANALFDVNCLLTEKTKELISLGDAHNYALQIIDERDQQLIQCNKKILKLDKAHGYAIKVVKERDCQLTDLNKNYDNLGKAHQYALHIIEERDCQLVEKNAQLQELGKNHGYAISIVEKRDNQLVEQNKKLSNLNNKYNCAKDIIEKQNKKLLELEKAHDYAMNVVQEREFQLDSINSKYNKLKQGNIKSGSEKEQEIKLLNIKLNELGSVHKNVLSVISNAKNQLNSDSKGGKTHSLKRLFSLSSSKTIDIIIPVYGGYKDIRDCLESVLKYQQKQKFNIIIIDDACPDIKIKKYLKFITSQNQNITILENKTNLGFVASVNMGMVLHNDNDVVLLNSDTIVSNNWLDRMHQCAYRSKTIGTVTPFSNNATICSFPIFCKNNDLSLRWTPQEIDQTFSIINQNEESVEIPTAVGFCMYIKRECIKDVGLFDVKNFGRGYGEENDFCMRAMKKGWKHELCVNTFVYHTGGVSFSVEKEERIALAMETMNKLHCGYHKRVHEHIMKNPASSLRVSAMIHLIRKSPRPVVLFISHNLGGGTEKHIEELVAINKTKMDAIIIRPGDNGQVILSLGHEIESESLYFFLPDEYAELVKFCKYLQVTRIHFHHILGLETSLWGLYKDLGILFDITFHDYYFINANPKLVNVDMKFCDKKETRDSLCVEAYPIPGGVTSDIWRRNQALLLKNADRIFAPSQYMANLMQSYFPYIKPTVTYHSDWEQDAPYPDIAPLKISSNEPMKILVLGALSQEKGAFILESCALLAKQKGYPIEFHIIGYAYKKLNKAVIGHGVYQNECLSEMIGELKPHLVWFPALWPETYSYTLSESLKVALPIVAPDIGSFAERLAGRPFSWIVPWDQSVSQRLDLFLSIREELLSIDDISTNGKWVQDPEKKLREFSYSKHYLVPSDSKPQSEKNQPEKNQIDAQWIRKYSNRIEKKENYSCNKQHKPLINFFTKVKENKIGSKIMDYLPEKLKLAVKKRIIPNNK